MSEKQNETIIETCVLTLGELMSGKVTNDKIKNCEKVAQYFNDKKYQLTIPFYQRAYVWSEDMVKIMLEDIDEQRKEGKNYLLGSLIIHIDDNEFNIVDGQQRLTTLDLILKYLDSSKALFGDDDNKAGSINGREIAEKEKEENQNSQTNAKTPQTPKGKANEAIKNWFNGGDKNSFLTYLTEHIEFVCVFTDSIDDAFIFFDSANAKGKPLKAYDLIKAFHLRALLAKDNKTLLLNDKQKEQLKLKINLNDSIEVIEVIKHYARYFEELAKKDDIKILFNDTLTPARQWIRYNTNKIPSEMDIYKEFCKEISQGQTTNSQSKNSLGILQTFMGGADFFEYIQNFNNIYNDRILKNNDFYAKLNKIREIGFVYNRYLYIAALLIYFDKFPKDNAEYMVRLIARAVFSLRVEKEKVGESTIKNYAVDEKILSLIYFANYEWELESELKRFIGDRIYKESGNNNRTKATQEYLELVQNDGQYGNCDIAPHPKPKQQQGGQNG